MKKQQLLFIVVLFSTVILAVGVFSPNTFLYLLGKNSSSVNSITNSLQATLDSLPTQTGKNIFLKQSHNLTQKVDPELVDLDSQIITCSPNVDSLLTSQPSAGGSCVGGTTNLSSIKGKYLSGQCCGALLNTKERHANLKKLQAYKSIPDIPLNPYKTPVAMAKKWIDYNNSTTLTNSEQSIYNQALKMSMEGPCCCKCWHYFEDEGIAKKMIITYHEPPKKIAAFWDASDICGTGQTQDT